MKTKKSEKKEMIMLPHEAKLIIATNMLTIPIGTEGDELRIRAEDFEEFLITFDDIAIALEAMRKQSHEVCPTCGQDIISDEYKEPESNEYS